MLLSPSFILYSDLCTCLCVSLGFSPCKHMFEYFCSQFEYRYVRVYTSLNFRLCCVSTFFPKLIFVPISRVLFVYGKRGVCLCMWWTFYLSLSTYLWLYVKIHYVYMNVYLMYICICVFCTTLCLIICFFKLVAMYQDVSVSIPMLMYVFVYYVWVHVAVYRHVCMCVFIFVFV